MLIRVLLLIAAVLLAVPNLLLTGARLIGGHQGPPVPQLAAFSPWATLGWAVVLIVLLLGRWWWVALPAAVLLALQLVWVLPTHGAGAASADGRAGAVAVRVMTVNTKVGGADVAQILALAQAPAAPVDVLAVEEGQPQLIGALAAALHKQLPYSVHSNPNYPSGTVVWSRWPVKELGTPLGRGGESVRMSLQVPGAAPVTLTAVHTISPTSGRVPVWNSDLQALATASRATTGAQVMLGDFNASRDHSPLRDLLGTGLVDGAEAVHQRPWAGVTWPADIPHVRAFVRLDHVLVTPGTVGVRSVRVEQVSGTDHRAVLAELVLGTRH